MCVDLHLTRRLSGLDGSEKTKEVKNCKLAQSTVLDPPRKGGTWIINNLFAPMISKICPCRHRSVLLKMKIEPSACPANHKVQNELRKGKIN